MEASKTHFRFTNMGSEMHIFRVTFSYFNEQMLTRVTLYIFLLTLYSMFHF